MHKTLDVITIGEAMAMFVATETGELSAVEYFIKRVAGAEPECCYRPCAAGAECRLGKPRGK